MYDDSKKSYTWGSSESISLFSSSVHHVYFILGICLERKGMWSEYFLTDSNPRNLFELKPTFSFFIFFFILSSSYVYNRSYASLSWLKIGHTTFCFLKWNLLSSNYRFRKSWIRLIIVSLPSYSFSRLSIFLLQFIFSNSFI